jgi:sarcosine oxidase / L-pipecolate oxidase
MSTQANTSYLILGAGIFGTSTAYHLSKKIPNASITLVDKHSYPVPECGTSNAGLGASYDLNKIVRADYSVPFYMDLAYEAIDAWSSMDLVKPYFHRSGWMMMDEADSDLAKRVKDNFATSQRGDPTKEMTFEQVKQGWHSVLKGMSEEGMKVGYFNPESGWAEADRAVAAMLGAAIANGVEYVQGDIEELLLRDSNQGLKGIRLASGDVLEADKILIATGAWTSKLMAPLEDKLEFGIEEQIESQVKAVGVTAVHWKLNEQEKQIYDDIPVIIYGDQGALLKKKTHRSKLTQYRGISTTTTI